MASEDVRAETAIAIITGAIAELSDDHGREVGETAFGLGVYDHKGVGERTELLSTRTGVTPRQYNRRRPRIIDAVAAALHGWPRDGDDPLGLFSARQVREAEENLAALFAAVESFYTVVVTAAVISHKTRLQLDGRILGEPELTQPWARSFGRLVAYADWCLCDVVAGSQSHVIRCFYSGEEWRTVQVQYGACRGIGVTIPADEPEYRSAAVCNWLGRGAAMTPARANKLRGALDDAWSDDFWLGNEQLPRFLLEAINAIEAFGEALAPRFQEAAMLGTQQEISTLRSHLVWDTTLAAALTRRCLGSGLLDEAVANEVLTSMASNGIASNTLHGDWGAYDFLDYQAHPEASGG